MPSSLVNRLLVWLARALHVSPGIAQVMLLCLMMLLYVALEPTPLSSLNNPMFYVFFGGASVIVVLVTWLTKGEYRKHWWKSEHWRQ
jgi:hypothetical protein